MGLFDRNDYGRDYGRPGGHGLRGMWNRMEHGVRDAMGAGGRYDREYAARQWDNRGGGGLPSGGYAQGGRGGWLNAGAGGGEELNRYGRDLGDQGNYGYRGAEGAWSTVRNHGRYDGEYGAGRQQQRYGSDFGGRYGRDYQGGMQGGTQTDAGDPFGDRQSRTPFRVIRGEWDRDRGGSYQGGGYGQGQGGGGPRYDVEYRGYNGGIGDEPGYQARDFNDVGYDRDFGRRRRGWF